MIQLEIFLVILLKEIKLFGNIIFTRTCTKKPKEINLSISKQLNNI